MKIVVVDSQTVRRNGQHPSPRTIFRVASASAGIKSGGTSLGNWMKPSPGSIIREGFQPSQVKVRVRGN